jgi:hypothetical protein
MSTATVSRQAGASRPKAKAGATKTKAKATRKARPRAGNRPTSAA